MREVLIGFVLVLILLPVSASAQDYYVDKDSVGGQCNNNNPGTINSPWCTITKANSALQAGDTVYIRAGIYEENDQNTIIKPRNSGSEGNYITYTNYNNEDVILRSVNSGGPTRAILLIKNYINIDGLKINNIEQSQSNMEAFALFSQGADYNIIQNCEMLYLNPEISYAGIRIYEGSTYNKLLNNTIRYVASDSRDGSGDCIFITHEDRTAQYNLIEGNTAEYCGHSGANIGGQYNIVRNNNFRNPWQKCLESIIPTNITSKSYNVFENNDLHGTETYTGDLNIWVHALQMMDSGLIVRRNRIYDTAGVGTHFYAKGPRKDQYNKFYHNVIYDTGTKATHNTLRKAINFVEHDSDGLLDHIDIRNNIFYECPTGDFTYGGFATASDHNDVNNHKNGDGDPKFINGPNYNFHLEPDSPCIDGGAWLTVTRSAGNGRNIPVNDASYFIDGFGIVEGDLIQLEGQTTTARITNVNYATNTITVDTPLTWTSGQGVSLSYSGSAPDIGAYEFQPSCTPECNQNSDCGTDTACRSHICSNPGTCSASCSSQDITLCMNDDGCCPSGCNEGNDNDCGPLAGPVALWHFDEDSGPIASDSSGNGNDGTINEAAWTTGISGGALEFDGINDYVSVSENDILDPSEITIETWIRIPSTPTSNGDIVAKGGNDGYRFRVDDDRTVKWFDKGNTNSIISARLVPINEWTQITVVGSSSGMRIYINGELNASNSVPYGAANTDNTLEIGAEPQFSEYFNGTIDEVRIYDRALTPEEISEHYNELSEHIRADLNDDNVVDILDLGIVAGDFGKTSGFNDPDSDTNSDGLVDIFDVVFVASRFS